jgi:hypothetical protein
VILVKLPAAGNDLKEYDPAMFWHRTDEHELETCLAINPSQMDDRKYQGCLAFT